MQKHKIFMFKGIVIILLFIYSFISFAEITAFSDRYAEFEKINTEVLGVSVDSVVSCFSETAYDNHNL